MLQSVDVDIDLDAGLKALCGIKGCSDSLKWLVMAPFGRKMVSRRGRWIASGTGPIRSSANTRRGGRWFRPERFATAQCRSRRRLGSVLASAWTKSSFTAFARLARRQHSTLTHLMCPVSFDRGLPRQSTKGAGTKTVCPPIPSSAATAGPEQAACSPSTLVIVPDAPRTTPASERSITSIRHANVGRPASPARASPCSTALRPCGCRASPAPAQHVA